MLLSLAKDSQCIDIVLDLYQENGIKATTRKFPQKSIKPVPLSIKRDDQQLSTAIDSFWTSESNKEA